MTDRGPINRLQAFIETERKSFSPRQSSHVRSRLFRGAAVPLVLGNCLREI
jgi:hypothetical protein